MSRYPNLAYVAQDLSTLEMPVLGTPFVGARPDEAIPRHPDHPLVRDGRTRQHIDPWSEADVPEAKAEVLHAIYERIVVTGRTIVSIRLTPAAYAHGLAVALPDKVALARPTGTGRAINWHAYRGWRRCLPA